MRVRRARAERFGALVATEAPPALVAVDRVLARRLGVEGGPLWEGPSPDSAGGALSGPTEVHLAATERCPAGCRGCYADATPEGHEPTLEELRQRLVEIARAGAFTVAFGGGESSLRRDIGALARHARTLGLTPTLTTSGLGITEERLPELTAFDQINVSHDGPGETYAGVRGYEGASRAEAAIRTLSAAGLPVGVNALLTRRSFEAIEETAALAEALGAVELQLLRLKPSGRARLDYLDQRLSAAQIEALPSTLRRLSEERALSIRIDCAMVPLLVHDGRLRPEDLSRFGVVGCEGARSFMTVDARGGAHPCSFFHAGGDDVERTPAEAFRSDPTLDRFRAWADAAPEPCASCDYRPACRGGCRVVADHLGASPWAPDPECPRVRAFAG